MYELVCIVKIIRGVKRAEPGRAEPSEKYQYTAAAAASLRERSRAQQAQTKHITSKLLLKFTLYLDEASDKKYTAARS